MSKDLLCTCTELYMCTGTFDNPWCEEEEAQMIVAKPKAEILERRKKTPMILIPKAKAETIQLTEMQEF